MIGELIKDARKKVGMTQDGLAVKAGIRAGNVSRLERRASCQTQTLEKIAEALGLKLVIQMNEQDAVVESREPFVSLRKIREELEATTTGVAVSRPTPDVGVREPVQRRLTGAALRNAGKPVIKAGRVETELDGQKLEKDPEVWG